MKKLSVLLAAVLLCAGCTASVNEPEPAENKADWSHMKELVEDSHVGVDLLGWIGPEEDVYEKLG